MLANFQKKMGISRCPSEASQGLVANGTAQPLSGLGLQGATHRAMQPAGRCARRRGAGEWRVRARPCDAGSKRPDHLMPPVIRHRVSLLICNSSLSRDPLNKSPRPSHPRNGRMTALPFAVNSAAIDSKCRLVLHPVPWRAGSRDLFRGSLMGFSAPVGLMIVTPLGQAGIVDARWLFVTFGAIGAVVQLSGLFSASIRGMDDRRPIS